MLSDEEIRSRIVLKLYRRGNWGSSHTSFENLKKGFTHRDTGKRGSKRVNRIGEDLIRENVLLSKPTGYGLEVSLNPQAASDIRRYLGVS